MVCGLFWPRPTHKKQLAGAAVPPPAESEREQDEQPRSETKPQCRGCAAEREQDEQPRSKNGYQPSCNQSSVVSRRKTVRRKAHHPPQTLSPSSCLFVLLILDTSDSTNAALGLQRLVTSARWPYTSEGFIFDTQFSGSGLCCYGVAMPQIALVSGPRRQFR